MFKKLKELNKTKSIILTTMVVIVLVAIVGTTVAWLTSRTSFLDNTFTYGEIQISIVESSTDDGDDDVNTNNYVMMPGVEIPKDTRVIVAQNSEDCWLFIKIIKENDFDEYMTYSLEDTWTELEGYEGIYYTKVDKKSTEQSFNIIKGNVISVKPELTYADIKHMTENSFPTLEIKAYAVQRNEKMDAINDPVKAWKLAYNPAS